MEPFTIAHLPHQTNCRFGLVNKAESALFLCPRVSLRVSLENFDGIHLPVLFLLHPFRYVKINLFGKTAVTMA